MKPYKVLAILFFPLFLAVSCKNSSTSGGDPYTMPDSLNTVYELVNDVRTHGCYCGGVYHSAQNTVTPNATLEAISLQYSTYMNTNNTFSHTDLNGNNGGDRLDAGGYHWAAWGEVLAKGQITEREVFQGWLNSSAHCEIMMNKHFDEFGLGHNGSYWTMMFAKKL